MSITSRLKSLIVKSLGKHPEDHGMSSLARNFKHDYGYLASVKAQKPIDFHGRLIPWLTYPAIKYLESLNLSDANILSADPEIRRLIFPKDA